MEFSDGAWEELTRRELRHGITLAAQVSSSGRASSRAPCFKLGCVWRQWCGWIVFVIQDQPVFSLGSDSILESGPEERQNQVQAPF